MIYTTNFANLKKLDRQFSCPIAICGKSPNGYKGLEYKKLAPPYWLLKNWKEERDENLYIRLFYDNVLYKLTQKGVIEDLRKLINDVYKLNIESKESWWKAIPFDIYLVCYEKPENFCHRHLVAEWMCSGGIRVEEAKV